MKHITLITLLAALALTGCRKDNGEGTLCLKVQPFALTHEEIGAKAPVTDGATRLDLVVFDQQNHRMATFHQASDTSAAFGTMPSLRLPAGRYYVVAVGHNYSDTVSVAARTLATIPDTAAQDMFAISQRVDIVGSGQQTVNLVLDRTVAAFRLVNTGDIPSEVADIQFRFSGGGRTQFAPTTFCSPADLGSWRTYARTSAWASPLTLTAYLILATSPQTMDVTLQARDASGTALYTATVEDAPLHIARRLTATGNLFSAETGGTITLSDTTWTDGGEVPLW